MPDERAQSRRLPTPRQAALLFAIAVLVMFGWHRLPGREAAMATAATGVEAGEREVGAPEAPDDATPDLATSDLAALAAAAYQQLERNALTRPAGANAVETWLAALAREPLNPEVRTGLETTLRRLGVQVALYLDQGRLQNAHDLHFRARDFATRAGLTTDDIWRGYKQTVRDGLAAAIERAAVRHDRRRAERLAELAQEIDPDHPDLVPARERIAGIPRRGEPLAAADGPPLVLVRPATDEHPALAAMTREVSRGEYEAFVAATRRAATRCHDRLSLLQLFDRRRWDAPGFAQDDTHPVVCVSAADAQAYAAWLSERLGQRLRLPTAEEWHAMAGRRGGNACALGHIDCGDSLGTVPADAGNVSALGLRGLRGNVAEWLADCAGDCSLRLTGGASWRDRPEEAAGTPVSARPADRGHDDVGFRLVREIEASRTP